MCQMRDAGPEAGGEPFVEGYALRRPLGFSEIGRHLSETSGRMGVPLQAVRPQAVVGRYHALACMALAERAHEGGWARTRSLELEVLLYLAATDQIGDAVARAGLPEGADGFVLLAFRGRGGPAAAAAAVASALGAEEDPSLLEPTAEKARVHGLPDGSGALLPFLAAQRSALIDVR